jgi:hypothetical protein
LNGSTDEFMVHVGMDQNFFSQVEGLDDYIKKMLQVFLLVK